LPTESFVATGADQDVRGQCLPDTDDPRGPRGSDHARQMTIFPRDGHCDRHGLFMICTEKIGEKTTSVMYRLDDAKDGSDSKVLSVWSREW
jgi:hypothetical protein